MKLFFQIQYDRINTILSPVFAAVSHIPLFRDAVPPAGDLLAFPHFGICDTTHENS